MSKQQSNLKAIDFSSLDKEQMDETVDTLKQINIVAAGLSSALNRMMLIGIVVFLSCAVLSYFAWNMPLWLCAVISGIALIPLLCLLPWHGAVSELLELPDRIAENIDQIKADDIKPFHASNTGDNKGGAKKESNSMLKGLFKLRKLLKVGFIYDLFASYGSALTVFNPFLFLLAVLAVIAIIISAFVVGIAIIVTIF